MNGRELAEALLRASSIEVDDAGDVLAKSVKGQGVIKQLDKQMKTYLYGSPPPNVWDRTSIPLKRRTKT